MSAERATLNAIEQAVQTTVEANAQAVRRWKAQEPGSWGFLAGQAVDACRRSLSRRLLDEERRQVWRHLWIRLSLLELE